MGQQEGNLDAWQPIWLSLNYNYNDIHIQFRSYVTLPNSLTYLRLKGVNCDPTVALLLKCTIRQTKGYV